MKKSATLRIGAARYADRDDCLAAAADDVSAERGLAGYDLSPRWEGGDDGERAVILIDIPEWATK